MAQLTFDKSEYGDWIKSIEDMIRSEKSKVVLSVNQQPIELYRVLRNHITSKIDGSNLGSKVIQQISIGRN